MKKDLRSPGFSENRAVILNKNSGFHYTCFMLVIKINVRVAYCGGDFPELFENSVP